MASVSEKARYYGSLLKKDETVSLYVEGCEEPYRVPRTLLTRISHWFESALSDKFIEGQKLELRFPETETGTLELFLYWLFEGSLPRLPDNIGLQSYDEIQKQQPMYVQLWVFADKHLIPMLENAALVPLYGLTKVREVYPTIETVRFAFENTAPESNLREYMLDVISAGLVHYVARGQRDKTSHGYTTAQLGSMSDVPGFTEELARNYLCELNSPRGNEDLIAPLEDYLIWEGEKGRGKEWMR